MKVTAKLHPLLGLHQDTTLGESWPFFCTCVTRECIVAISTQTLRTWRVTGGRWKWHSDWPLHLRFDLETHLGAYRRDPGRTSYSSTRRWAARSRRYGCAVAGADHLERMERRDVAGRRGCVIGGVPTRATKETEYARRRTRASSGRAGRCRGIVQSRGGVFKVLKGAWSPQSGGRLTETNWHGARRLEERTCLTGICSVLSSPHCHGAYFGVCSMLCLLGAGRARLHTLC